MTRIDFNKCAHAHLGVPTAPLTSDFVKVSIKTKGELAHATKNISFPIDQCRCRNKPRRCASTTISSIRVLGHLYNPPGHCSPA